MAYFFGPCVSCMTDGAVATTAGGERRYWRRGGTGRRIRYSTYTLATIYYGIFRWNDGEDKGQYDNSELPPSVQEERYNRKDTFVRKSHTQ